MAETVLVTGGTGFVAGWCIVELLRARLRGAHHRAQPVEGEAPSAQPSHRQRARPTGSPFSSPI